MTLARLCGCGNVVPWGVSVCNVCARERLPDRARRQHNNLRLGRRGAGGHWRKLSLLARQLQPYCSVPGCTSQDLTVDLGRGGDHRTATLEEVRVLCRSHHGQVQGGGGGEFLGLRGSVHPGKSPRVSSETAGLIRNHG